VVESENFGHLKLFLLEFLEPKQAEGELHVLGQVVGWLVVPELALMQEVFELGLQKAFQFPGHTLLIKRFIACFFLSVDHSGRS
jgi:hypothetical protein